MQKKIAGICLLSACLIASCGVFGNNNIPTIPLPPQKTNASDAAKVNNAKPKTNASQTVQQMGGSTTPPPRIQEDRSTGGTVDQIKVNNPGDIPDYYIYPSQGQNLNINNQPDKNLATPSWQISW